MTINFIDSLICPNCNNSVISLSSNLIKIKKENNEIINGTLSCKACKSNFPIILGIPILVSKPLDYCSLYRNEILMELYKYDWTKELIEFINKNSTYSIYGNNQKLESWQTKEGIDTYIFNQYKLRLDKNSFINIPEDNYNFYEYLSKIIKNKIKNNSNTILDIACNTGGMLYYLQDITKNAIGLDYSFSAILKAQRILKNTFNEKNEYLEFIEAQKSMTRKLEINYTKNINFLVADAINIPLKDSSIDITTSVNILEIVPNSKRMLKSIERKLKNLGIHVNSTPFYWREDRSLKSSWLLKDDYSDHESLNYFMEQINYKIIYEDDEIPWILKFYKRYFQVWLNSIIIGEKTNTIKKDYK